MSEYSDRWIFTFEVNEASPAMSQFMQVATLADAAAESLNRLAESWGRLSRKAEKGIPVAPTLTEATTGRETGISDETLRIPAAPSATTSPTSVIPPLPVEPAGAPPAKTSPFDPSVIETYDRIIEQNDKLNRSISATTVHMEGSGSSWREAGRDIEKHGQLVAQVSKEYDDAGRLIRDVTANLNIEPEGAQRRFTQTKVVDGDTFQRTIDEKKVSGQWVEVNNELTKNGNIVKSVQADWENFEGKARKTNEAISETSDKSRNASGSLEHLKMRIVTMAEWFAFYEAIHLISAGLSDWARIQTELDKILTQFKYSVSSTAGETRAFLDEIAKISEKTFSLPTEAAQSLLVQKRVPGAPADLAERSMELQNITGITNEKSAGLLLALQQQMPGENLSSILSSFMAAVTKSRYTPEQAASMLENIGPMSQQMGVGPRTMMGLYMGAGQAVPGAETARIETFWQNMQKVYDKGSELNTKVERYIGPVTYNTPSGDEVRRPITEILDAISKLSKATQLEISTAFPNTMNQQNRSIFTRVVEPEGQQLMMPVVQAAEGAESTRWQQTNEAWKASIEGAKKERDAAWNRLMGDDGSLLKKFFQLETQIIESAKLSPLYQGLEGNAAGMVKGMLNYNPATLLASQVAAPITKQAENWGDKLGSQLAEKDQGAIAKFADSVKPFTDAMMKLFGHEPQKPEEKQPEATKPITLEDGKPLPVTRTYEMPITALPFTQQVQPQPAKTEEKQAVDLRRLIGEQMPEQDPLKQIELYRTIGNMLDTMIQKQNNIVGYTQNGQPINVMSEQGQQLRAAQASWMANGPGSWVNLADWKPGTPLNAEQSQRVLERSSQRELPEERIKYNQPITDTRNINLPSPTITSPDPLAAVQVPETRSKVDLLKEAAQVIAAFFGSIPGTLSQGNKGNYTPPPLVYDIPANNYPQQWDINNAIKQPVVERRIPQLPETRVEAPVISSQGAVYRQELNNTDLIKAIYDQKERDAMEALVKSQPRYQGTAESLRRDVAGFGNVQEIAYESSDGIKILTFNLAQFNEILKEIPANVARANQLFPQERPTYGGSEWVQQNYTGERPPWNPLAGAHEISTNLSANQMGNLDSAIKSWESKMADSLRQTMIAEGASPDAVNRQTDDQILAMNNHGKELVIVTDQFGQAVMSGSYAVSAVTQGVNELSRAAASFSFVSIPQGATPQDAQNAIDMATKQVKEYYAAHPDVAPAAEKDPLTRYIGYTDEGGISGTATVKGNSEKEINDIKTVASAILSRTASTNNEAQSEAKQQSSLLQRIAKATESWLDKEIKPTVVTQTQMLQAEYGAKGEKNLGPTQDNWDEPVRRIQAAVNARIAGMGGSELMEKNWGNYAESMGVSMANPAAASATFDKFKEDFYSFNKPKEFYEQTGSMDALMKQIEHDMGLEKSRQSGTKMVMEEAKKRGIDISGWQAEQITGETGTFEKQLWGSKGPDAAAESAASNTEKVNTAIKTTLEKGLSGINVVKIVAEANLSQQEMSLLMEVGLQMGAAIRSGIYADITSNLVTDVINGVYERIKRDLKL